MCHKACGSIEACGTSTKACQCQFEHVCHLDQIHSLWGKRGVEESKTEMKSMCKGARWGLATPISFSSFSTRLLGLAPLILILQIQVVSGTYPGGRKQIFPSLGETFILALNAEEVITTQ